MAKYNPDTMPNTTSRTLSDGSFLGLENTDIAAFIAECERRLANPRGLHNDKKRRKRVKKTVESNRLLAFSVLRVRRGNV